MSRFLGRGWKWVRSNSVGFTWSFFSSAFGFLASWLLGFLAFRPLCFLASWLFGFLASWLFGLLLVYAAFGGFLALGFCILCIPSSNQVAFVASRWSMRLLVASAFRILYFPNSSPVHWFLASRILSITITSSNGGGCSHPPTPPAPPPATFWIVCKDLIAPLFGSSLLRASNFVRKCCKIRHFK